MHNFLAIEIIFFSLDLIKFLPFTLISIPRYLPTMAISRFGSSKEKFQNVLSGPMESMTVFSNASFIRMEQQTLCTVRNSFIIPRCRVRDIRTKSSAKNNAEIIVPSKVSPAFVECSVLTNPEIQRDKYQSPSER